MRNRRNYYRILHVQRDAPAAVIKASYRAILQRLGAHPDLGGDHAEATLINEAFATLSDPARRAAYDRAMANVEAQRRERREAAPSRRPAPPPATHAPAGGRACAFCGLAVAMPSAAAPDALCPSCGSALGAAQRHKADSGSRRAVDRLPRQLTLTFRLAASRTAAWHGTIEDLSLEGMQFLTPLAIPVGERLQIECDFCSAVAVVKRVTPGTGASRGMRHYGVEFLTLLVKRTRGSLVSTKA